MIGLALHELATNAGKYRALPTDWGAVGDVLTMSWTGRDGPPVSAPERRAFGTTVIETMAKQSLDGEVDLDYVPSLGRYLAFGLPSKIRAEYDGVTSPH